MMQIYNPFEQSTGKISISKGNQLKMNLDHKWYKADFLGYEGASEVLASAILKQSNITYFVDYKLQKITLNDQVYNGCVSDDFLKNDEELVTAYRLFLACNGIPIESALCNITSTEKKVMYFVDFIEKATGIDNFGQYLTLMLEWDRFVLNEDRHFNNIAFIKSDAGYRIAPLFDNGAAFLSDLRDDYPLNSNIHGLISRVQAKPFSDDFDKQTDICIRLYGSQLKLSKHLSIPSDVKEGILCMYGDKISNRMAAIMDRQCYNYMEYLTEDIQKSKCSDIEFDC